MALGLASNCTGTINDVKTFAAQAKQAGALVYVDDAWRETIGGPSPMEEDMLDFGYDVRPSSRLSCQIKVTDAIDGLVVRVPERQA